jgi:hypothetical protein
MPSEILEYSTLYKIPFLFADPLKRKVSYKVFRWHRTPFPMNLACPIAKESNPLTIAELNMDFPLIN